MPNDHRRARLVVAGMLALAALGFGPAALAGGNPLTSGAPAAPGPEVGEPPQAQHLVTLTGRIEAVKKNFLGWPKAVAIDVPQVGSFLIDDSGKGKELEDHVGDVVTLVGTRKVRGDGMMVLAVERYQVHPG
jgi:hypothetical protein